MAIEMRVNKGGLFRCCLTTLADYLEKADRIPPAGTTLDCRYEPPGNRQMVVAEDGVWEWCGSEVE